MARLAGKVALITGGARGQGAAEGELFVSEGATVYLTDVLDDEGTALAARIGATYLHHDVTSEEQWASVVERVVADAGRIDVLVNNAAEQHPANALTDIPADQIERTFRTNVFGYFFLTQAALPQMPAGAAIVNTTSVTAYRGSPHLVDYASTRGAIVAFTRSMAQQLAPKGIRVNAVAPGPIWTPLIPASFGEEKVESFGAGQPLGRPGEPNEVASCHLFLACADASYMSGQVLHPNGGEIVGG